MQNHRKFPGNGHLGLLETDAFPKPVTPRLERAPFFDTSQQDTGGLEQVASQHRIAALGDAPCVVDLSRGITPWRQSNISANAP